jgi:hypothetical protein
MGPVRPNVQPVTAEMDPYDAGMLAYEHEDLDRARHLLGQAGFDARALLLLGQLASRGRGRTG